MKRWICTVCLTMILMLGILEECVGKTGNGQQPPVFTLEVKEKSVSYTELREAEDVHVAVLQDENEQCHVSIPERTQSEENINAWLCKFYEKDAEEYEDFMGIGIEESEWYLTEKERKEMRYSYNTTLYVERADDAVISFLGYTTTYGGGNHANTHGFGVNFDARSGSVLELSDILFDTEEFCIFANGYIEQNYNDYAWMYARRMEHERESMMSGGWYMGGYGICLLCDIASGVSLEFGIPYEYLVDYLKPEYFPTSREAEYSLRMGVGAIMDVNGDGVMDVLTQPVNNGDIWEISINGTVSELSLEWNDSSFAKEVGGDYGFSLVRDEEGVTRLIRRAEAVRHECGPIYHIDGEYVITYRIEGENVVLEDIVKIPRSY